MFIKETLNYTIREDNSVFILHIFESVFIEIVNKTERNVIVGVICRPNTEPHANIDILYSNIEEFMATVQNENKLIMHDNGRLQCESSSSRITCKNIEFSLWDFLSWVYTCYF